MAATGYERENYIAVCATTKKRKLMKLKKQKMAFGELCSLYLFLCYHFFVFNFRCYSWPFFVSFSIDYFYWFFHRPFFGHFAFFFRCFYSSVVLLWGESNCRGSRVNCLTSRVNCRGSRVNCRGSRVNCRGSRVNCRGSRINCRG